MSHVSKFILAAVLLCAFGSQPSGSLAQQKSATANLQIDLPDVVAEVRAAHERYEQALVSNNDAILGYNDTFTLNPTAAQFWPRPTSILNARLLKFSVNLDF